MPRHLKDTNARLEGIDVSGSGVPDAISRRAVLNLATTGVVAGWAASLDASALAAAEAALDIPAPRDGFVDAHSHVWTPDVKAQPLAEGFTPADMVPASFMTDELFAHAAPLGVTRAVLIQMSFYGFDNSYMLSWIRKYPDILAGVAVIDHEAPHPKRRMEELSQQGVHGFRLFPQKRPVAEYFASPGIEAMWRTGAANNQAMCLLINPADLPAAKRMCERFPDTPVVVDHFARIGVDGTIRDSDLKALCALAEFPLTYVKTSAFYALGRKRAPYTDLGSMVERLCEAFGPERLMWATDCPYQVQEGHRYDDSLALIRDRLDVLSPADKDWLLRKTATKVFFRD